MTPRHGRSDAGQAFPIYLTVVGGLLFLALAYFAVGQAAANRNGAQTAADAAALAAAQDTRDQLAGQWVEQLLDPTTWQDIFDGRNVTTTDSCGRADALAGQNGARVLNCVQHRILAFTVEVEAEKPVGDSIVPGTENTRSRASATAVVEPLCTFRATGEDDDTLPQLRCEDVDWDLDPEETGDLPKPSDLFEVHLADQ
ncbi:pilus assembly protein TadG-related protein [Streptomyces sp. SCSIO 75703]|uniref:pilus assembly protein TadG-related protein n=1 Tax=unclassified Streptomyces TaxID=2593676 RepID=UPI0006B56E36|nr:pilus assembly protein TadG-related protein [Streptomyces sp. TP-A0875]